MPEAEAAHAVDPATGWLISPIIAASLCIKPRAPRAAGRAARIDASKSAFLRGSDIGKLDVRLDDARASGICAIMRFVRTLRQDIAAVGDAITGTWSNGQVEGQINRLRTLKRAMRGRANVELLRA